MQPVGEGVVDRLDLGVVDDVLVRVRDPLDPVLLCVRVGSIPVASSDDDDARAGSLGRLDESASCDARCAQDANPQLFHEPGPYPASNGVSASSNTSSSRSGMPYSPIAGISGFNVSRLSSTAPTCSAHSRKPRR